MTLKCTSVLIMLMKKYISSCILLLNYYGNWVGFFWGGGLCLETWSQSTVSVIKVELQLIIIIVNLLEGYYFYTAFC